MKKKLRVFSLDGPGDSIESFHYWKLGLDNPNITHVPFSGQFYDVCQGKACKTPAAARVERQEVTP